MTSIKSSTRPLVSIIIPAYNYGGYLRECVASLQNQVFENWECIIVDDGSTDCTAQVVSEIKASERRISYIFQPNSGLSAARNSGIKAAKGDFIQLLDADDLISPYKLDRQVQFMTENSSIDISFSDAFYFLHEDPKTLFKQFYVTRENELRVSQENWIPPFDKQGIELVDYLVRKNIAPVNSYLLRREVFSKVGYFDVEFKSLEDWEFWLRCALAGVRFTFISNPDAYALVRIHRDSMSFSKASINSNYIKFSCKVIRIIRDSDLAILNRLYDKHIRFLDLHTREVIASTGLLNVSGLGAIMKQTGRLRFLKLYAKELVSYIKKRFSNV